ncbi:hypothetical protein SSX86_019187 [Deinandra increscens subsp. villosa]|uniref:BHLH domain-containing protein n=1 Tax=Deinandra increscens subsp. villosa TaxID=3103831 RepID=A0AAP0CZB0_9ASTR
MTFEYDNRKEEKPNTKQSIGQVVVFPEKHHTPSPARSALIMSEILQIFHQSPRQRGLVNVESQCNRSFRSDSASPGSFDVSADRIQCSDFAGSPFANFSSSSVDELSKVTAVVEKNQSLRKREFESVDSDFGLTEPPKARRRIQNENSKPKINLKPKPDYVHVRARRGQATDNHSLAERARREKIKKKMQYLQDLVPGCNKLTNKAAILDEIITYVQCLQWEIEFLTMKLAMKLAASSSDFNMNNSLLEEQIQFSQW